MKKVGYIKSLLRKIYGESGCDATTVYVYVYEYPAGLLAVPRTCVLTNGRTHKEAGKGVPRSQGSPRYQYNGACCDAVIVMCESSSAASFVKE